MRSPVILLSVLLVVALVGWFTFDFLHNKLKASGCSTTTVIRVTAAPDIAPVVTTAAQQVSAQDDAGCYKVTVSSRDSSSVAESLAVSDGSERPDVWIPESTMWLQRAQDKGAWNTPVSGTSIAQSPVVLALTEDKAADLGWPAKAPSWAQVIGPAAGQLPVGFPDPAHDPVGVSTLFGLQALARTAADPGAALTAGMRSLSANTVNATSDLYSKLPGGTDPGTPVQAFPTSENALLRHNVKNDGSKLVAVYADPQVPGLDYPYVVLPDAPDFKRQAAEKFLDKLMDQESSDRLADAGFRTPDGKMLRDRSQDKHVSSAPMAPVGVPEADQVTTVLNTWAAVNLSGRVQVLLDVSGSMNEPVPGTGKTRMDVTLQAATAGVSLFKPTTKIGWWLFSTKLDGDKDYTVLLPMKTVAEQVADGAVDKLRAVKAKENGGTGLYDSVLAAYKDARSNWEVGRLNVVIVMTDGKNDDKEGINLNQLLDGLKQLQDPRRPLPVVGIGIGDGVDRNELDAISGATGGKAFVAPDPTKIGDVFYAALSTMLCQPPVCKQPSGG